MARDDRDKRLEQAIGDGREWVERTAADVAERLSRAWSSVRDRTDDSEGEKGSGAETALFDESQSDPEELFSHDRQHEVARLGHANILIIGQTGVGKSTLINAVFRKPLARAATGRPVTKVIERFEDPDVPVTLYDTKGVELGDSKNRVIKDFKRIIAKSRKAAVEEHIHLLWYCMDAGQTRVQDYDVDIIRALAEDVHVVLVFTQTIDDERADALEATIRESDLPIEGGAAIRTLAERRRIGRQSIKPRGLEELVRITNELLPEAVRRAFINAQGVVIDLKVDQSRTVVVAATAAAAGAAAAPIPGSDAALLQPIQLGMLAGISAIFGIELSNEQVMKLVKSVIGQGGIQKLGKTLVKQLAKYVPGGNVLNATVAAALTGALGEAYIRLCAEALRREAAGKPMPDAEMLKYFTDAYEALLRKPGRTANGSEDNDSATSRRLGLASPAKARPTKTPNRAPAGKRSTSSAGASE
jgi:uncharacterized protein (DUF697 family)/GTP-binding protein EngB required for normal cell division